LLCPLLRGLDICHIIKGHPMPAWWQCNRATFLLSCFPAFPWRSAPVQCQYILASYLVRFKQKL
jgi:hypothetical protein